MSAPVVGIATQNGRLAVTFTRDGKLEGWAYFDELSYEARDTFLEALEIQKKNSRGKIDLGKIAQELRENDPFVRTRCRALARVAMAHRLGFEAECLPSDTDGVPHLVLKVPESVPQEKRIEDWLTVYFVGLEAEKQIYGSYTGDGNGEIGDLAGQFHLDKSHLLKPSNAATEQQRLGDLRGVEVSNLTQELRDLAIKLKDDRHAQEAALDQPYHLVFFRATDREGRTRFFDLMPQTDGVSIAETAVSAPKLGECVETAYGLPDRRGTHHVHRLYGKVRANTAREAIDNFAKLVGLRQVVEIAETQTQREAGPTWKLVFEKLGCPPTCTDSKPAARTKAREEDTKLAAQGRRILVVHHERVIAEVICKLLLHEGYGAQMVCSSSEAIAKALEWIPQFLIIDPVMPGVSGIVAAKEICGQTKCKVLLISASAKEPGFADILNNLRNNGCDCEAFPLPFEKEDLLEHVRERIGPPSSRVNGISLADSTSKATLGAVPKTDLVQPRVDGEAKNRATTIISLETIDALLKSANVVTRMEQNSLMFKGFIGETRVEISPSGFRTPDGLEVSEIIRMESVLEKMPVTWNDGLLCAVNMAASNGALTVDSDGKLRIRSRMSLFSGEPREVLDVYVGIIFLGSMIHTNAVQASIVDAWHLPISKAEPLPDSDLDGVWGAASFERTLSMMRKAGIFANGGDALGLTAEFPWDPGAFSAVETLIGKRRKRTSLLRMECMEHPNLGKGLFCRLDLPLDLKDDEAFRLAIELNKMEFTAADWPPFLGAWTSKPGSGRPTFVSFWPNCFAKIINLELMATWLAARAKRVPEWVRSNTGFR
jgi:CheY-like chemotaxis protein